MGKTGAYFTVEAALVLPMVIGVILFVIYVQFFLYNRCLMEQDAQSLALKGVVLQEENAQRLLEKLKEEEAKQKRDKYIVWNRWGTDIVMKQNQIMITQSGSMLLNPEREWKASIVVTNHRTQPANDIRRFRKIIQD